MSQDCLKITTYFGERDRSPDGLLADRLLDLYERRKVPLSILLRGAEGFGAPHHLRTDRLLTLSEDLPVVSMAIDRQEKIESLLEPLLAIKLRGLLTLERVQVAHRSIHPSQLPASPDKTIKLTIFLGRHQRTGRGPTFVAVTDLLHRHGIAGASVLLGVDGSQASGRDRARFFGRNRTVPTMIVAVCAAETLAGVIPELQGLLDQSLLTLERVRVCKRDGQLLRRPQELPESDPRGRPIWQKLTVYTSQNATHDGRPIAPQIIRRLAGCGAAGATSQRGIWGFHGEHPPHGDRLFQTRRHTPVLTTVIDTPQRIAHSFQIIDELTREHGLVTSEMVPAVCAADRSRTIGEMALARWEY